MKFKFTIFTLIGILVFHRLSLHFEWDLFEKTIKLLQKIDKWELDELYFLLPFLLLSNIIDILRLISCCKRKRNLSNERLKTLQATMHNVQDIVNNFLNGITYYKYLAEEKEILSSEQLKQVNDLIQTTTNKLNSLGDIKEVDIKESPFLQVLVDEGTNIEMIKRN